MLHETQEAQEAQEAHECRRQSRLAAQADALQADALEVRPGAPHERGVG